MDFLNIPENIIYRTLDSILTFLREDLEQYESTPQKSYLYKLCGSEKGIDDRFDFFKQAKKVFTYQVDDPKYLNLNMMYNLQDVKPNSITISHSGESSGQNVLGQDQNSIGVYENADGTYQDTKSRRYNATYSLTIVTENTGETLLIYNIIKSMLISFEAHLIHLGLTNLKMGGSDIQLRNEHIPKHLNSKNLTMNFEYNHYTLDTHKGRDIGAIIFKGLLKEK